MKRINKLINNQKHIHYVQIYTEIKRAFHFSLLRHDFFQSNVEVISYNRIGWTFAYEVSNTLHIIHIVVDFLSLKDIHVWVEYNLYSHMDIF